MKMMKATAPTESAGCTIDAGQEAIMETLAHSINEEVGDGKVWVASVKRAAVACHGFSGTSWASAASRHTHCGMLMSAARPKKEIVAKLKS
jgi:hypothetical protein